MLRAIAPPRSHPGIRSSAGSGLTSYYGSTAILGAATTAAIGTGILYYQPLSGLAGSVFDRFVIEVTAGAAGVTGLMGLYRGNGSGLPGSLIVAGPSMDLSAAAFVKAQLAALEALSGDDWLALAASGAVTVRGGTVDNAANLGADSLSSGRRGMSAPHPYGPLPAAAPPPTTWLTTCPYLAVERS